jgi:AbrB family looped-hinge helix DNA binding protein
VLLWAMKSKLTSRGRFTLPKPVRKALAVKEGDTVIFELNRSGVVQLRTESSSANNERLLNALDQALKGKGQKTTVEKLKNRFGF